MKNEKNKKEIQEQEQQEQQKKEWIKERKNNPAHRLMDSIEMESIFTGIETAYYSANEQHKEFCIQHKIRPHDYSAGCCNIAGDIDMAAVYILKLLNQLKDEKRQRDFTRIRPNMMADLFMIMHIINTTFVGRDFQLIKRHDYSNFESSQFLKDFQSEYYENMYLLEQAKHKKNPREDSQYI